MQTEEQKIVGGREGGWERGYLRHKTWSVRSKTAVFLLQTKGMGFPTHALLITFTYIFTTWFAGSHCVILNKAHTECILQLVTFLWIDCLIHRPF